MWLDDNLGTKDNAVRSRYQALIKTLQNIDKLKYNDEYIALINIPFSPFKKFKIPKLPPTKKRALQA
ncbi:MAG: hypothetical protein ACQPRJ_05275 [Solitalea-like symbiont of Acarus siro]